MTRIFRLDAGARRATFMPVRIGAVTGIGFSLVLASCSAEKEAPEGAASSRATATRVEHAESAARSGAPGAPKLPATKDKEKDDGSSGGIEVPPSATAEIGAPVGGDHRRFVFQAFTTDDVAGRLKQEDVAKTFADNERTLGACLSVDAVAKIKLKVSPSGRVSEARVKEIVPNDPRVRDCIARELSKLTFPKLQGAEPATVEIDVALRKT